MPEPAPTAGSYGEQLRHANVGTAVAFFCGSMALVCASIHSVIYWTKPLGGVGLLLGVAAGLLPAWKNRAPLALPLAVCGLCSIAVLFVGKWPAWQAPAPPGPVFVDAGNKGMAAHQPIGEDEWVDASAGGIQWHYVRVQVVGARLGTVELQEQGKKVALPQKQLVIRLRLTYHGAEKPSLNYEPWANTSKGASKHPPTLTDTAGNSFTQVTPEGGRRVAGRDEQYFLTTGGPMDEVLVFPAEAADAAELRLTLPASAIGSSGAYQFKIPRSFIKGS
jgi:hypothetical protein